MERFSITEVALTGFRIVRERPKVVPFWAAAQLVFSGCLVVLMVITVGPALTRMAAVGFVQPHPTPAQTLEQFRQILPMYLVFAGLGAIFYPILYGAMNRAVLRPNEDRFGYLRVGSDELRQFGLFVLLLLCAVAAYVVLVLATALVIVLATVAGSLVFGRANPIGAGAVIVVATVVAVTAAACAWIYAGVRLSLASPLTFATGRVNLFGSWGLTRKIFWPALGSYLVAFVLLAGVWLLYLAILLPLDMVIGGGVAGLGVAFHPDMNSLATYFSPVILLNLLVGAVLSAMMWPIMLTPPAAIYDRLTLGDASKVFG